MKLIVILKNLIFKCPSVLTAHSFDEWNHKFQLNEEKKCGLGRGKWICTFYLFGKWWIFMLRWRMKSIPPKKWTVLMILAGNGHRNDGFSKYKLFNCPIDAHYSHFMVLWQFSIRQTEHAQRTLHTSFRMVRIFFHSNANKMFVVQLWQIQFHGNAMMKSSCYLSFWKWNYEHSNEWKIPQKLCKFKKSRTVNLHWGKKPLKNACE